MDSGPTVTAAQRSVPRGDRQAAVDINHRFTFCAQIGRCRDRGLWGAGDGIEPPFLHASCRRGTQRRPPGNDRPGARLARQARPGLRRTRRVQQHRPHGGNRLTLQSRCRPGRTGAPERSERAIPKDHSPTSGPCAALHFGNVPAGSGPTSLAFGKFAAPFLVAVTFEANRGSWGLMERLGMRYRSESISIRAFQAWGQPSSGGSTPPIGPLQERPR